MKKYFSFPILVLLFFSTLSMHALVEPISINDGIWSVLSRVGIVVDDILEVTGCHYFVHQTDLPLTINAPGNYCLVQSVTFNGTAVTINSSGVNFDMRNYTMDANFNTNSVAFRLNGGSNISIRNGSIQNTVSGAIFGNGFLENILISDIDIMQNIVGISFANVQGLRVQDCYLSNGGGINIVGSGIALSGCKLDDSFTGTGAATISIQGVSSVQLARDIIVQDCSITGSYASAGDGQGIIIQNAQNALVSDCIVSALPLGAGIIFSGVNNVKCRNCLVENVSEASRISAGIQVTNANFAVIESCNVFSLAGIFAIEAVGSNNVLITDCIVSNNASSYGIVASGNNIVVQRCFSSNNGQDGYLISPGTSAGIKNVVIKDCVAGKNNLGYDIQSASVQNVIFTNCLAQGSAGDGFVSGAGSNLGVVLFDHCAAQDNAVGTGFHMLNTFTVQFNNCCTERNAFGYIGGNCYLANSSFRDGVAFVAGAPVSMIKTGALAISNATYWNNVALP